MPEWLDHLVAVIGTGAAIAAGILLALHRHRGHEDAERVGQFCLGFVFFAALAEMNNEVARANTEWHLRYVNGAFVSTHPAMPYRGVGGFLKALYGPYVKDLASHLAVSVVAFVATWLVLSARRPRPTNSAG